MTATQSATLNVSDPYEFFEIARTMDLSHTKSKKKYRNKLNQFVMDKFENIFHPGAITHDRLNELAEKVVRHSKKKLKSFLSNNYNYSVHNYKRYTIGMVGFQICAFIGTIFGISIDLLNKTCDQNGCRRSVAYTFIGLGTMVLGHVVYGFLTTSWETKSDEKKLQAKFLEILSDTFDNRQRIIDVEKDEILYSFLIRV